MSGKQVNPCQRDGFGVSECHLRLSRAETGPGKPGLNPGTVDPYVGVNKGFLAQAVPNFVTSQPLDTSASPAFQ